MTTTAFLVSLGLFAFVGVLSARRSRGTAEDYLLAGRDVPPWLTALSSVATNNSGFMFIGLIGFAYRFGVQVVWLQAGWVIGDLLAWLFVHGRVREVSGRLELKSVPALLSTDDDGNVSRVLSVLAAVLTIIFLGGYAAAQLNAGSAALHVLFGWHESAGAILGAAVVVLYSFSGGLRASIWTDAAQACVILFAMVVLLWVAAAHIGGPAALLAQLGAVDPELVRWVPENLVFGFGLYLLGFVAGGFGVVGQPHILVRSMALRSVADIPRTRRIYFMWYVPFSLAAVAVGLYSRLLLPDMLAGVPPDAAAQVAEQALPRLSQQLLPDVMVGVVLAGLFAATMSTADSQLLSCSAAVTQDIAPRWNGSYMASKMATLAGAGFSLTVALFAGQGVFDLVLIAWSALGATLGPLLLLRLYVGVPPGVVGASLATLGLGVVVAWGASPWSGDVFKLLPGLLLPLVIGAVWARRRWNPAGS